MCLYRHVDQTMKSIPKEAKTTFIEIGYNSRLEKSDFSAPPLTPPPFLKFSE